MKVISKCCSSCSLNTGTKINGNNRSKIIIFNQIGIYNSTKTRLITEITWIQFQNENERGLERLQCKSCFYLEISHLFLILIWCVLHLPSHEMPLKRCLRYLVPILPAQGFFICHLEILYCKQVVWFWDAWSLWLWI